MSKKFHKKLKRIIRRIELEKEDPYATFELPSDKFMIVTCLLFVALILFLTLLST